MGKGHLILNLENGDTDPNFGSNRSMSCRGSEITFVFPLNFVPLMKPQIDHCCPSPMNLADRGLASGIDDSFNLFDSKYNSDDEDLKFNNYLSNDQNKASKNKVAFRLSVTNSDTKHKKKYKTNTNLFEVNSSDIPPLSMTESKNEEKSFFQRNTKKKAISC